MQLEIRNAIERDRLIYNALGFIAGCLIAVMFFRRVSFMIIAAGAAARRHPARARHARLARFPAQHVPQRDDAADHGDQLLRLHAADLRGARPADRRRRASSRPSATRCSSSARPACSRTPPPACRSSRCMFSQSDLIRTFGEAGLIARRDRAGGGADAGAAARHAADPQRGALRRAGARRRQGRSMCCAASAAGSRRRWSTRPGLYTLIAAGRRCRRSRVVYAQLAAALPARRPGARPRAGGAGGAPARRQAHRRQPDRRADRDSRKASRSTTRRRSPSSPTCMRCSRSRPASAMSGRWRPCAAGWPKKLHAADVATLKQYVDILPKYLTRRFISADQDAVIVNGRVPDIDASQLLPVIHALDRQLDRVRAQYPGYTIAVTGLSAIAARNSAIMIDKLEPRPDHRDRLRRRLHRHRLPLADRDAGQHPARHLPDRRSPARCCWRSAWACSSPASSRSRCRSASA